MRLCGFESIELAWLLDFHERGLRQDFGTRASGFLLVAAAGWALGTGAGWREIPTLNAVLYFPSFLTCFCTASFRATEVPVAVQVAAPRASC